MLVALAAGTACETSSVASTGLSTGGPATATPRVSATPAAPSTPRGAGASQSNSGGYSFVEMTTGGAGPGETLPMVVALHGLGDRPESFIGLFRSLPARVRVVAPRTDTAFAGGFAWFALSAGNPDSVGPAIAERADSLAGLLRELPPTRPTRGKPIVTGFSQGGALAFALAARHPGLVAAAVPIAGWLPTAALPESKPVSTVPVTAFHGTADTRIPFQKSRDAVDALGRLGFPARLEPAEGVEHSIPADLQRRVLAEIALRAAEASSP